MSALYVATTNAHKAEEIRAILAAAGVEVRLPENLPEEKPVKSPGLSALEGEPPEGEP